MSHLLIGEDEMVKKWIIDKIDCVHNIDPCVTIGVISNHKLIAAVAYHDYQKHYGVIQISMAAISPMWARKIIIYGLLRYPFEQLCCYKVIASVRTDNSKALKTFKNIGFEQEAVLKHNYGEGQHAVIIGMLKPDYDRIFGVDNGQKLSSPTCPGGD
ncbi:MAG: GNAT family protein [Methylococcales bacterium]